MTTEALTAQGADWLRSRHQAVLATARRDGTPQTSNVVFAFDGSVARISVTTSRAKTVNMLRHPRVVLHVLGETFWQYAAITCEADISEPSTEPGDEVGRRLLELYESVAPAAHPDPDEFFRVQVAEGRVVATLTPITVVATGLG
jgi:PPOX class probable F420-dependent enzyme